MGSSVSRTVVTEKRCPGGRGESSRGIAKGVEDPGRRPAGSCCLIQVQIDEDQLGFIPEKPQSTDFDHCCKEIITMTFNRSIKGKQLIVMPGV